ncbi:unnamed protein product [Scytosiphon promiscuus]
MAVVVVAYVFAAASGNSLPLTSVSYIGATFVRVLGWWVPPGVGMAGAVQGPLRRNSGSVSSRASLIDQARPRACPFLPRHHYNKQQANSGDRRQRSSPERRAQTDARSSAHRSGGSRTPSEDRSRRDKDGNQEGRREPQPQPSSNQPKPGRESNGPASSSAGIGATAAAASSASSSSRARSPHPAAAATAVAATPSVAVVGTGAAVAGDGINGAPSSRPPSSSSSSSRHGTLNSNGGGAGAGAGAGGARMVGGTGLGTLAGLAPTVERRGGAAGDDASGGTNGRPQSPPRRTEGGSGGDSGNGRPTSAKDLPDREADARGGGGWMRDVYRAGGSESHWSSSGGDRGGGGDRDRDRDRGGHYRGNGVGAGGGLLGGRGVVRERDRPDSPRDRGRYIYNPPELEPSFADSAEHSIGSGTLSVSARRATLGYRFGGRGGDWQDMNAGASRMGGGGGRGGGAGGRGGGGGGGGGYKRPRSPEPVAMDLDDGSPSPQRGREQESYQNQDYRGERKDWHQSDRCRGERCKRYFLGGSHALQRPRERGSPLDHAEVPSSQPGGHLGTRQNSPRHNHQYRNSPGPPGGAGGSSDRLGRSTSHTAMHPERGGGSRGSPLAAPPPPHRGSPIPTGPGVGSDGGPRGSPLALHSPRHQRPPAITDRLVSLKAEFLELHDMLLESDFQWEESQRFCEVLKLQLDQLMLVPHRHRDSLAPPT